MPCKGIIFILCYIELVIVLWSYVGSMARWDIGTIEDLPNYMQIIFRTLWEVMQDIESEMSSLGRPGGLQPTIDEVRKCY